MKLELRKWDSFLLGVALFCALMGGPLLVVYLTNPEASPLAPAIFQMLGTGLACLVGAYVLRDRS